MKGKTIYHLGEKRREYLYALMYANKLKTKVHNIKVEILKRKVKYWEKIFAKHIHDKTDIHNSKRNAYK